ncbi:MAG: VWA domain-containing protein [Gammaproteobacteria bacterium]|nr:VWA domain-containing protein [Gammaproteobacteria bacterium]
MLSVAIGGCSDMHSRSNSTAVYMLLDSSGTYTEELAKAQTIVNYLLMMLDSGDSIAVARIDSGSFSEKDIIAKVTFDERPSAAIAQKKDFKHLVDQFIDVAKGSAHTDISGGVLQASQFLDETGAAKKYVLIFSDLEEDLIKSHIRDFAIPLEGVQVVALNVTKLRADNIDPRKYLQRLDLWQKRINDGGGDWRVVNDLEHLDRLLSVN